MDNYNYPLGADTKDAPWNQVDPESQEIEVTISITMSKTVKISVDDYECTEEDDHTFTFDYSKCNLEEAVENQIYLPHEIGEIISKDFKAGDIALKKYAYIGEDLSNWNLDDFGVYLE